MTREVEPSPQDGLGVHWASLPYFRIRTVPGIGKILCLVILYEIHDINRFPSVQDFASYCRLVKPAKESGGKSLGSGGAKIGNVFEAETFFA